MTTPRLLSSLPDPWSLDGLSGACRFAPRRFPYFEGLLQWWFRSAAGQWFCRVRRVTICLFTLSLSDSLSARTLRPCLSEVPSATRDQNLNQMTITSVYIDSFNTFIQARQDKQCAHSSSPLHSHTTQFTPMARSHTSGYDSGWLLHQEACREQPPRGAPWVSGLVGHLVQTWPDSECSHTV